MSGVDPFVAIRLAFPDWLDAQKVSQSHHKTCVQCNTVQYSTMQYSTVQYSTIVVRWVIECMDNTPKLKGPGSLRPDRPLGWL